MSSAKKDPQILETKLLKYVHGGQAIGVLETGQKAFIWGGLPGELVRFQVTKKRSDYVEGLVTEVLEPSSDRMVPRDSDYLNTSPWQIVSEAKEDEFKKSILAETMDRAGVSLPGDALFNKTVNFWHYRNKMEYSFYGDDDGLHLALYNRGTHQKNVVIGSSIAHPAIDDAANQILDILRQNDIRAGDLKTLVVRCSLKGETAASLFVKDKHFLKIRQFDGLKTGIIVVYSNPKSPASIRTKDLYEFGKISLTDEMLGHDISYDVFSFFQVNVPVFETALTDIKLAVGDTPAVDLYSGVGSIGLALDSTDRLVELDDANVEWAKNNATGRPDISVTHAKSEQAHEYIDSAHVVIVDPPRAGLHRELVDSLVEKKPPKIVYLSCNPSTQARDIALLQNEYTLESVTGYNFFPRTPHIESLVVLIRKQ